MTDRSRQASVPAIEMISAPCMHNSTGRNIGCIVKNARRSVARGSHGQKRNVEGGLLFVLFGNSDGPSRLSTRASQREV